MEVCRVLTEEGRGGRGAAKEGETKQIRDPSRTHLSPISCRPVFNGFHMNPKLSQMEPVKMKRCPYSYLRRDLLHRAELPKGMDRAGGGGG